MSIFFTPVIVKDMEKNLDITKPRYSEKNWLVPSLYRGSTEEASKIQELPLSQWLIDKKDMLSLWTLSWLILNS